MKIAVAHNLPAGGALRTVSEQVRRLGSDVREVYTLAGAEAIPGWANLTRQGYSVRSLGQLHYPFGRLNGLAGAMNLAGTRMAFKKMARDIDEAGCGVVLVHPCMFSQTPSLLVHLRTPSVYYCHEPFRPAHEAVIGAGGFVPTLGPARGYFSGAIRRAEFEAMRRATLVLCNSHYTREYLLRCYGIESTVNYPGVDTDLFRPLQMQKRRLVVSVGRLSVLKGHEFVIDSLSTIDASVRPVLCVAAGPCPSEDARMRTMARAERLGVVVRIVDNLSDDDLVTLYNTAVVSVVGSMLEPFGLVPIESMACGTPVVAVAEGGLRETVVDGVTGYLTARDTAQFGDAVRRVIEDPVLARDLGEAGRREATEKWNWQRSISTLRSSLAKAAGGGT